MSALPSQEIENNSDELDLGDGHKIIFSEYKGQLRVGGDVVHPAVEGKCSGHGWISFRGRAWEQAFEQSLPSWEVVSEEPLTLSPSVLCRACGDHGNIVQGKWVRA